ncbi:hypothetical protein ACLBR5_13925 [Escherichia coli]
MTLRRLVGKYICVVLMTFYDQGFASNNTGLSGTVGSRDQFNYGVNLSYQNQGNENDSWGEFDLERAGCDSEWQL